MSRRSGFTLMEALVSVTVMGILATVTGYSLLNSSRVDQLNTAARVVAADLRAIQARALTAGNIKTCPDGGAVPVVCENSTAGCAVPAQCANTPPAAVGIHLTTGLSSYDMFADVRPASNDWIYTAASEVFQTRKLTLAGAPNVVIFAVSSTLGAVSPADVVFERQNGLMVLNGCRTSQGCNSTVSLVITLKQTQINMTKTITLNAYTGRISIQ